jgi:methyl-accepting chemotaxis protein
MIKNGAFTLGAGSRMQTRRFAIYGALFGIAFPLIGTIIEAFTRGYGLAPAALLRAQIDSPLLWIIDTAPFFLGVLASLAGRAQDQILALDDARREGYLKTASELFTAAQGLLSTVSSFSSMTAETAASVRETTATMGQLGQTATKAALTAETVIGLARQGEKVSVEGLSAVETSLGEMMKLTDEVRGLSGKIEALNGRMRDIFEIASVVSYIADRSQKLADRAAGETAKAGAGAGGRGFAEVVAEMRSHSEDAKKAAVQVKGILNDVHKAMLAAMTAAEVGIRRAEQGATVASSTGETIRRLATALRDSSQAAKEIATVAQQQDHGIDQVLKAMNEIYLATQETMSSTKAVATEAKALNDLASGLKRAVEA